VVTRSTWPGTPNGRTATGADVVVVTTIVHDHVGRVRSRELSKA